MIPPGPLLVLYLAALLVLSAYGLHRYWILYLYWRHHKRRPPPPAPDAPAAWPVVTVQLPLYNEVYVAERLIDAVCALDYPKEALHIQVLDDSTDETRVIAENKARALRARGVDIHHIHRAARTGFKAGALAHGLKTARGAFVAVFDADFIPPPDFLKKSIPHFAAPEVGMVQTRWGHVNADYSFLTRVQSIFLDGHFVLEHTARHRAGAFINFNGTAGVWRRAAIDDAGGWSADTLTEDLDLSYRAQLRGWRFIYLPDVVCPAELPVDIGAFRSQQHRWTKGTTQVARKILPALWRGRAPLFVKLESTAHLTANFAFPLVLLLAFLAFPGLVLRRDYAGPAFKLVELAAFLFTTLSIGLFYIVADRESGTRRRWNWRSLPALMAFGAGMCWNNTRAVAEGLFGAPNDFRRTAKFGVRRRNDGWRGKRYRGRGRAGLWEIAFAAYVAVTILFGWKWALWSSLPLLGVFLFGFAAIGFLSLLHGRRSA